MENFFDEICSISKTNLETRIALETQRTKEYHEKIRKAVYDVYNNILNSNWKEYVYDCANKGYNKATIFTFNSQTRVENTTIPLVMLFKGPRNDSGYSMGLEFFDKIECTSLMTLIENEFAPFKIFLTFDKKDFIYNLNIIW